MATTRLVSYAQNGEDIVLWRALGHVQRGRYVDVGANSPETDSVTKLFYDRGWSGLDVEPVPEWAEQLRRDRPRDIVVQAAVGEQDGGEVVLHEVPRSGLSTVQVENTAALRGLGHEVRELKVPSRTLSSLVEEHVPGLPVHFCKIDVEGAEPQVLRGVDLHRWRPWVLVVEATRPNSPEPTHEQFEDLVLSAGYRLCLFDGLSRFYVADEHADLLGPALSVPANPIDDYALATVTHLQESLEQVNATLADVRQQLDEHLTRGRELGEQLRRARQELADMAAEAADLRRQLVHWRGAVLERWAAAVGSVPARIDESSASAELDRMRATVSWRVTAPLRAVRTRQLRLRA